MGDFGKKPSKDSKPIEQSTNDEIIEKWKADKMLKINLGELKSDLQI